MKNKNNINLKILRGVTFLLGFQMSLVVYIRSSYFKEAFDFEKVGILFLLSYAASLFVLLNFHHLVKKYGKSKVLIGTLFFKFISLLGMGFFTGSLMGGIFGLWSVMAGALMVVGLDILIENFSSDKITGTIRGANLSMLNLGYFLAPFLAVFLISSGGYAPVFFLASLLSFVALVIVILRFPNINHNMKRDLNIRSVFGKIWKKKNIARIYYVSFLLEFFYAIMVVYTPIYLLDQGFSWLEIGKIFTVMLIPFVIIQYPIGILADKKTGEKELLMIAIVFMAIATGAITFLHAADAATWMVVLFATRVGAAMIEVLRDAYFFKQISCEDVDLIDFYKTARDTGFIAAMIFSTVFLLVFELSWIFLVCAVIILSGLIPLWKLRDTN